MVFPYDLTMPEILRRNLAALLHAGLQGGLLAEFLWLGANPGGPGLASQCRGGGCGAAAGPSLLHAARVARRVTNQNRLTSGLGPMSRDALDRALQE